MNQTNVGILGGGQLGCMLADAALGLGLSPRIYAEHSSPASALFADLITHGSVNEQDESKLRAFLMQVSHVVFENEFLNTELLERAASRLPVKFGPDLKSIRSLQDKLAQKHLLARLGLPTSPFLDIQPGSSSASAVFEAFARFSKEGPVFKWSRMGYDGKGVLLAQDTPQGRQAAVHFCETSLSRGIPVYAEARIPFKRELAIVASLSTRGEFTAYPLVLSEQLHGICKRVLGPATSMGVPTLLEEQARAHALKLAQEVGLTGTFALELFETQEGELSINEIAPRVHNTGHFTQDACPASQFENHWRALLGLPLGEVRPNGAFGMLNLLGPENLVMSLPQRRTPEEVATPEFGTHLHWYAKKEIRPWRKLGHLNGVVSDASQIPALEKKFEQYQQEWIKLLSKRKPFP